MIQEIAPKKFDNAYHAKSPKPDDFVLVFRGHGKPDDRILLICFYTFIVRYLSLVHREEARLVEIIQTINVERCWRRPSTMMRLLLCRN